MYKLDGPEKVKSKYLEKDHLRTSWTLKLLKWGVVRYTLHSTMNCNEIVVFVHAMTNGEPVLSLMSTVISQSIAIKISKW